MIVSPSILVQIFLPILGVGLALFGTYLAASGAYRAWDRARRDAIERVALEKKRAAEVHLAEEEAENEQLRELWSEGARERLEAMRKLKKRPPGECLVSRLSDPEIAEIRARLDARSPGSWIACVYPNMPTANGPFAVIAGLPRVYRDKSEGLRPEDARFIANAPHDVERLLVELAQTTHERIALYEYVKTLEADVARLEDAVFWGSQGPPSAPVQKSDETP